MTDQATPPKRFRTSCTNCAAAKVKCRASRPDSECLRCRERGLACVFAPSNRYGRRPSRPAGKCRGHYYYGCPSLPRDDRAADHDAPAPPVELVAMSSSSMDWPLQMQSSSMLPVTPPLDWSLRGSSSTMDGVHHTTTTPRTSNGILNPTPIETETTSAPPNPPLRGTIFSAQSDTDSNDSIEIETSHNHNHNCLAQATEVLVDARAGQDFGEWIRSMESRWWSPPPPTTTSRGSLLEERCMDAELIMGDVIFTNRKILDHTFSILECDCDCARIDYQILVVISLVWFHLIDKYSRAVTAVTAAVTITTTSSSTIGPIDRHSRNRLTGSVQILMNELRGLAPVIETLSARGAEGRDAASRQGEGDGEDDGEGDTAIGASVSVFRQIQDDLTRHLGQVYLKADQLQQDLV